MRRVAFWGLNPHRKIILCAALFGVAVSGCTTIVGAPDHQSSTTSSGSTQRIALQQAAAQVAEVKWPKPTTVSMTDRLIGAISVPDDRVTKKDAVGAYVAMLHATDDAYQALLQDARDQLVAAAALVAAAEGALGAVRPAMSDVGIVEGSIVDLRQSRDIYLASLELVSLDKDTRRSTGRILRDDFDQAIKEVGNAADSLADQIAKDRTQTIAKPVSASNFTGEL